MGKNREGRERFRLKNRAKEKNKEKEVKGGARKLGAREDLRKTKGEENRGGFGGKKRKGKLRKKSNQIAERRATGAATIPPESTIIAVNYRLQICCKPFFPLNLIFFSSPTLKAFKVENCYYDFPE